MCGHTHINYNKMSFQADNGLEYVLEAPDVNEMKQWLSGIQFCMKPAEEDDAVL